MTAVTWLRQRRCPTIDIVTASALLVCGDAEAIQVFTAIFQELDIAVECSADVNLARSRVAEAKFDVVMLDCAGNSNALALVSAVRNSQGNRSALVIAMVNNPAQSTQAFSFGTNYVLYKPVLQEHISQSRRASGTHSGEERRGRPRMKVKLSANISFAAREAVPVELTDLSEDGAALKSAVALPASGKVYFQFFLPGANGTVPLSGEVMWQNSGQTGIRFANVPQSSQRALKKFLQTQSPVTQITSPSALPDSRSGNESLSVRLSARLGLLLAAGNSRRNLPRYPCRLGAEIYRANSRVPQRCNLTDLNHEGCYVETSEPFAADTAVRINVRTQGFRLFLEGIVRISHGGYGMGIKFTAQSPAESEQLERLVEFVRSQPI